MYDRAHTRSIRELGGLVQRMPYITLAWVMAALASLGLPGFVGFIAEFEIFVGTFGAHHVGTFLAVTGIVLSAAYLLWMLERAFFGPMKESWNRLKDMAPLEVTYMTVMLLVVFAAGVFPAFFTTMIDRGVAPLVSRVSG